MKTGVKTQSRGAVDVATSRSNRKGFTAAGSQDSVTNFLDSVESAKVQAGNNVSNLIIEVRVFISAASNVNNVETTIVSTRGSIGKSMNGHKTTLTSSNSPSHWGGGAKKGVGGATESPIVKDSPVAKARRATKGGGGGGVFTSPEARQTTEAKP